MKNKIMMIGLFISLIGVSGTLFFYDENVNAIAGLKVFVGLEHKGTGIAKICVIPLSDPKVCELFELSTQSSGSYFGPIETNPGSIKENETFRVCVSDANDSSKKENCKQWINGPEKAPEYVSLSMPIVSPRDFDLPKFDFPKFGFP